MADRRILSLPSPRFVSSRMAAELCPSSASFFGFMGVTSAIVFASALFWLWQLRGVRARRCLESRDGALLKGCEGPSFPRPAPRPWRVQFASSAGFAG